MADRILAAYCAHGGINAVSDETLDKLDIVYYAFGVVKGTDIIFSYPDDLNKVKEIKAHHPDIKVILCIGGGGSAEVMTKATLKEEDFLKVTDNIFSAMVDNGFSGIDLDWEFPTTTGHPDEREKHTKMLKILRNKMNALPQYHTLSIACPFGGWSFKITELERSYIYLDYINIMTYDMTNAHFTSHHTAPYSSNGVGDFETCSVYDSIKKFKQMGIPPQKILIGGAFYSKKWSDIKGGENGFGVSVNVPVSYGPCFTQLKDNYINKNGYNYFWDEKAQAPYLYNGDTFITYEDEKSLECKCKMVVSEDIGGIMVWELSGDKEQILLPKMRRWIDN